MKTSTVATVLALCLATSASPVEERGFNHRVKTVTETITHMRTKTKTKTKMVVSTETTTETMVQTNVMTLPASTITATVKGSSAPTTVTSMSVSISTLSICPSQGLQTNVTSALPSLTLSPSSTASKTSSSTTTTKTTSKVATPSPVCLGEDQAYAYPELPKNFLNCSNNTPRNSSYYYLQISGTNTSMDGSLLLSGLQGEDPAFFKPYNTTFSYKSPDCSEWFNPTGPYAFAWDRKNNLFVDQYGGPLATFPEDTENDAIGTWFGNHFGNPLSCYVTGSDWQVNCNGSGYDQLSYSASYGGIWNLIIGETGSSQPAATFNLVSPCAS